MGCSRALGVDFGTKRIGLAVSDPTNTVATPLETLVRREGRRPPYAKIVDLAVTHEVGQLVVGLPLDLSGKENEWCAEVRSMAARLGERADVPVAFVDERLTSVRAERALRAAGLTRSKHREKSRVDAAAAQFLLQGWLDAQGEKGSGS